MKQKGKKVRKQWVMTLEVGVKCHRGPKTRGVMENTNMEKNASRQKKGRDGAMVQGLGQ
jgi:hypothetical protein